MFGIGTSEITVFGILAVVLFGRRLPSLVRNLREAARAFCAGLDELLSRNNRDHAPRLASIELVTERRDATMKSLWKKFVWSPAFWAMLGIVGCVSGLFFQGVAGNGSGLWCLGLVFLGAAYIEKNP